jgi:hypothetical protein
LRERGWVCAADAWQARRFAQVRTSVALLPWDLRMLMAFTEYDTLPSFSFRTDMTASTAMLAKNSLAVPMILDDMAVWS